MHGLAVGLYNIRQPENPSEFKQSSTLHGRQLYSFDYLVTDTMFPATFKLCAGISYRHMRNMTGELMYWTLILLLPTEKLMVV